MGRASVQRSRKIQAIVRSAIARFMICAFYLFLLATFLRPAHADQIEDFYKGKIVNLIAGDAPGGGYNLYARLVARFLGAHIPGSPTIVVRDMPGAGSRIASGYIYNVAPKDGLSIGACEEALPLEQAVGDDTLKFDVSKFVWIGSPDADNKVVTTWHTSSVTTIKDVFERDVLMGATANTTSSQYMNVMNATINTRFKIIKGYRGGGEINLAMERGEVAGRGSSSWATWKARPDVLRDHKVNVLVQIGVSKAPELSDVPLLIELAHNADDEALFRLLSAPIAMGHPLFVAPGVPTERVDALRDAFDATMRDPAFLAEARRINLEIQPTSGLELQRVSQSILESPRLIRERLAPLIIH
jgi:tripartite-type tricarboxylate transporter receptor subunit TctC